MQQVRGFVFLEGKSIEDIKKSLGGFRVDLLNYSIFDSFKKNDELIEGNGIFIYGEIDSKYSSAEIVNFLREYAGLEKVEFKEKQVDNKTHYTPTSIRCDVSLEKEDFMREIKKGRVEGNYIGIRIKQPFNIVEIQDIAKHLGILIAAKDIYVRGVEADETIGNKPKACIELITDIAFEEAMEKIQYLYKTKLSISDIRTAKLFI